MGKIEESLIKYALAIGVDKARMSDVTKWDYNDEAHRTAATGFVSADVGSVACQQDDGSFWGLTAIAPPEWTFLGRGGEHIVTPDKIEPGTLCLECRSGMKYIGDTGKGFSWLPLTPNRQYFLPLVVPRDVVLSGVALGINVGEDGAAAVGIYGNKRLPDGDMPGKLLAAVPGFNTLPTGLQAIEIAYTLQAGALYWVSLAATSSATIDGFMSVAPHLGRLGNSVITHLYADGVAELPAANASQVALGEGAIPAIGLIEV